MADKLKSVYLQTTNFCNGECSICPYKDVYYNQPIKKMSQNLLFKILSDLGEDYSGEVGFYFQYEPLSDDRICSFLETVKFNCPKARTVLSTNASMLNKHATDKLVDDGNLDVIYFNILAGKKETYEKVQSPLGWDNMLKNVNYFASQFKGKMFVNYIKTNETKNEVRDLRKVLNKKINIISEYWASDRLGKTYVDVPKGSKNRFVRDKKCQVIKKGLYIYWDGVVPLCCECWEREVIIGDVKYQNVYDIFNSSLKNNDHAICRKCLIK